MIINHHSPLLTMINTGINHQIHQPFTIGTCELPSSHRARPDAVVRAEGQQSPQTSATVELHMGIVGVEIEPPWVYVYMYMHMHVYMCMYIYVHIYVHLYVHIYVLCHIVSDLQSTLTIVGFQSL